MLMIWNVCKVVFRKNEDDLLLVKTNGVITETGPDPASFYQLGPSKNHVPNHIKLVMYSGCWVMSNFDQQIYVWNKLLMFV